MALQMTQLGALFPDGVGATDPSRYVASGPSGYINPSQLIARDAPQFARLDKYKTEHWGWKVAAVGAVGILAGLLYAKIRRRR